METHESSSPLGDVENLLSETHDRRRETRYIPYDEKAVLVVASIQATVHNQSREGACLRVPMSVEVSPNEEVQVIEVETRRTGNVRWTTIDENGPHRLLGLRWKE